MHHRAKELPHLNLIADADALMRELNRAMSAVDGGIDQSNLKEAGVEFDLVRNSMGPAYMRSTSAVGTDVQDGTGKLFAAVQTATQTLELAMNSYTGNKYEADRNLGWTWIERSGDAPLVIELEVRDATRLYVVLTGQTRLAKQGSIAQGNGSLNEFDVRLLVNNTPLDEMATYSCMCNQGFMPFFVSTMAILRPGLNLIKAQIRDRTTAQITATAGVGMQVFDTYMYCYGHTR